MIEICKTFFDNRVKLIKLKKFVDKRGYFIENFNVRELKDIGISTKFFKITNLYQLIKVQ
jgi:dTDP-4-dehydrorhamnose 3,5-epimerase and related enzymes